MSRRRFNLANGTSRGPMYVHGEPAPYGFAAAPVELGAFCSRVAATKARPGAAERLRDGSGAKVYRTAGLT
jgi:hypothetical protein